MRPLPERGAVALERGIELAGGGALDRFFEVPLEVSVGRGAEPLTEGLLGLPELPSREQPGVNRPLRVAVRNTEAKAAVGEVMLQEGEVDSQCRSPPEALGDGLGHDLLPFDRSVVVHEHEAVISEDLGGTLEALQRAVGQGHPFEGLAELQRPRQVGWRRPVDRAEVRLELEQRQKRDQSCAYLRV